MGSVGETNSSSRAKRVNWVSSPGAGSGSLSTSTSRAPRDPVFWHPGAGVGRTLDLEILSAGRRREVFHQQGRGAVDVAVAEYSSVGDAHHQQVVLDRVAAGHEKTDRRQENQLGAGHHHLLVQCEEDLLDNPLMEAARCGGHVQHPGNDFVAIAIGGQLLPPRAVPGRVERAQRQLRCGPDGLCGALPPEFRQLRHAHGWRLLAVNRRAARRPAHRHSRAPSARATVERCSSGRCRIAVED